MKKWVAWSFFGVAVVSIFLVKMCVPTTRIGPVTVVDLVALADSSLAPGLESVRIEDLKSEAPDSSWLSLFQSQVMYSGLAPDSEWRELLASIDSGTPSEALNGIPVVPVASLDEFISAVSWTLARARLLIDQGSDQEACDLVAELSRQTALGLKVATSPGDLAIAGASRGLVLRFAARNAVVMQTCGLGDLWVAAEHRERLSEVLQADFFEELLPQISDGSRLEAWEWASSISALPDDEDLQAFFRDVLKGHTSAFDPEETATTASADLVDLRTGLTAHWRVFESWSDERLERADGINRFLQPILQLPPENLKSKTVRLTAKKLFARADNPLGTLMLDAVVQNYASAAENAFFMDFQEAAVLYVLVGGNVTSPISGAVLKLPVDGVFKEGISNVDERFRLILSLAESGWRP